MVFKILSVILFYIFNNKNSIIIFSSFRFLIFSIFILALFYLNIFNLFTKYPYTLEFIIE